MREIKFRAWDIPNKKMIPNVMIFGHSMGVSVTIPHGDYATGKHWKCDNFGNMYCDNNKVIPLQYTGLKDKHGVESYMDDLYRPWDDDRIYQIVWDDDNARFKLNQVAGSKWPCDMMMILYSDGGIIGNIHENPELVEGPNQ